MIFSHFIYALDNNVDGVIPWKENYLIIAKHVGLAEDETKESFAIIDANGNGDLRKEENGSLLTLFQGS